MSAVPNGVFVVVSGLPASGKSTLGGGIADRLSLPLIDKDVVIDRCSTHSAGELPISATRSAGQATQRCCPSPATTYEPSS